MWVTAEYAEEGAVAAGIAALAEAGFDRRGIEIFSTKPVELPPGLLERPSRASLIAVLAAIANGSLATAFIYYTQQAYPIVTGGMPLRSAWATGVITYELTMAGAMAGIVLAFLWESGVLRRHRPMPPRLSDNAVFVRVECSPDSAPAATERLARSGAVQVVPEGEGR